MAEVAGSIPGPEPVKKYWGWFRPEDRHKLGIVAAAAVLATGLGLIAHEAVNERSRETPQEVSGEQSNLITKLAIETGLESLGAVGLAVYTKNRGYIGVEANKPPEAGQQG